MYYVGIDWAQDQHQVAVVNAEGKCVSEFVVQQDGQGFARLQEQLAALTPVEINLERPDGLLVDWLVLAGYAVFVTAPRAAASHRSRDSKDDRQDARLLANLRRTGHEDCRLLVRHSAIVYQLAHLLRALDGFAQILIEDAAPMLDEENRGYLERIQRGALNMRDMIEDLLMLSRLSRQPLALETVAPAELVRQALQNLSAEQDGRKVEIMIGDLPTCKADPALLQHVFDNLLANALKYSRKREVARIEVGSTTESGVLVYYVRDNGVGFDMRYAHKLFGVFQRLHRAEDFEGVGVGLAIVRRVVTRHGGKVWVEAEPDRGATFYFSLSAP